MTVTEAIAEVEAAVAQALREAEASGYELDGDSAAYDVTMSLSLMWPPEVAAQVFRSHLGLDPEEDAATYREHGIDPALADPGAF